MMQSPQKEALIKDIKYSMIRVEEERTIPTLQLVVKFAALQQELCSQA
jgi:hypothetical protein